MFAPPPADPRWSVAIIRDNDAKTAGPYNVGSKIRDADDRRHRRQNASTSTSAAAGTSTSTCSTGPRPRAGAPAAAAPRAPTDPLAAELDKGIKKIGEHNYEVQRATLDTLLGNMGALARAARIVPETATASRPASACSASGPTARSRRSACRTATSSRRSTASR